MESCGQLLPFAARYKTIAHCYHPTHASVTIKNYCFNSSGTNSPRLSLYFSTPTTATKFHHPGKVTLTPLQYSIYTTPKLTNQGFLVHSAYPCLYPLLSFYQSHYLSPKPQVHFFHKTSLTQRGAMTYTSTLRSQSSTRMRKPPVFDSIFKTNGVRRANLDGLLDVVFG